MFKEAISQIAAGTVGVVAASWTLEAAEKIMPDWADPVFGDESRKEKVIKMVRRYGVMLGIVGVASVAAIATGLVVDKALGIEHPDDPEIDEE